MFHIVEVRRAENGEDYVRVKARNGEVLLTSETYAEPRNAETLAIALFRTLKYGSKHPGELRMLGVPGQGRT